MDERTCCIEDCTSPIKTRGMCGKHAERERKWEDPTREPRQIRGDDERRFWSKVDKRRDDQCWRWLGTHVGGYGQFTMRGQRISAHRHAYELLVGPIPEGLQIDHVWARGCQHRDCVNPAHLEPVTLVENVMRGNAYSAINARKVRCIRGHEFDRVIVQDGKTRRKCSICHRAKTAESKARRRARRAS